MLSKLFIAAIALCSIFFTSCKTAKPLAVETPVTTMPKAAREFRAAWVATVSNINWPSKPGLTVQEQQQEALDLLNFLEKHNFNAVILQIRPQADALYQSNIEPWSYFLTGEQGKAPSPFYDPLHFWINEAHNRGIELHVWLNPYRAQHKDGGKISEQSIIKTNPELVYYLKEGYWWLDPARKETQDLTSRVINDIVKRYDIDGVHFDDYFYPYPSYNLNDDFPDSVSWTAYQKSGGQLSRGHWRRASVNNLIQRLYKEIKTEKPYVKFGLSPFGIWRPGYPESVEGFDQYEKLYADARLWLNEGWIDYFAPQLYWKINKIPQSFPVLLGWWADENKKGRHLWPGMSVGRDTGARTVDETINQIMITRGIIPESKGTIHWSISSVVKNTKLAEALREGVYRNDALVPASPWLDNQAPAAPLATFETVNDIVRVKWSHANEKDIFRWVAYYQYGDVWNYQILNKNDRNFIIHKIGGTDKAPLTLKKILLTAVDRVGNESVAKEIILP